MATSPRPERKAVAYLEREVPLWAPTNHCFSCHNNGDAARALMVARKNVSLAIEPPAKPLADTLVFLSRPDRWNEHEADSPNKDARLSRLQFTSAMALAVEAKLIPDRGTLMQAAEKLAEDQTDDGSWPIESDDTAGSPATYGRSLATAQARRVLQQVDAAKFSLRIANADRLGFAATRSATSWTPRPFCWRSPTDETNRKPPENGPSTS